MISLLAVLGSLSFAILAGVMLVTNRRSVPAIVLLSLSLAVLLLTHTVAKALFIWLALLGVAGLCVTVGGGLNSQTTDSAN